MADLGTVLPERCCPVPSLNSGRRPHFRGAKPLGLDILCGVDHPGTSETESYMEKLTFTRACLSGIRVIMTIYVCTLDRVATSGSNGVNFCTRVSAVGRAWGL
jgi:hypothetical protein